MCCLLRGVGAIYFFFVRFAARMANARAGAKTARARRAGAFCFGAAVLADGSGLGFGSTLGRGALVGALVGALGSALGGAF